MHQNLSQEMWLHVRGREEKTPTRATLPCNKTLHGQVVGQIADSTEQNSHVQQTTTACQTA